MNRPVIFADVLEAAEQLDADAQAELVEVLTRRRAERGRERIAETVEESRREFVEGACRPMTAADLIREANE